MDRLAARLRRWLVDPRRRPRRARPRLQASAETLEGRALLSLALLRDINREGPSPAEITTVGPSAFFVTRDAATATLWSTDGTAGGVAAVATFPTASQPEAAPRHLTAAGGDLYFTALDSKDRPTLNRLRAGAITTVYVSPDGLGGEAIADLHASSRSLFFTTNFGRNLTALDLQSGAVTSLGSYVSIASDAGGARAVGDRLYFAAEPATGPSTGRELWSSDGTAGGTRLVADLEPGPDGSEPGTIAEIAGTAYFSASVGGLAGIYRVEPGGSAATLLFRVNEPPSDLVASNNSLYLATSSPATGMELYRSNGSVAAPSLVADLSPGATSSNIRNLVDAAGQLYFTDDREGMTSLFTTQGTAGTTVALGVIPIAEAPATDGTSSLISAGNRVFFRGHDASRGVELWTGDGTLSGTGPTADLLPGPQGADPLRIARFGPRVLFAALSANGSSLGVSDGSASGTRLLRDFGPAETFGSLAFPGSAIDETPSVTVGGTTYFVATDPDRGRELWKTDGTANGTVPAADLLPGPAGSSPRGLTVLGGSVYFVADAAEGAGTGLYRYDPGPGTVATVFLDPARRVASKPAVVGPRLAFLTDDGTAQLWRTDGTAASTALVSDFGRSLILTTPELESTGTRVFFRAFDGDRGEEMWRSDLTPAGTGLIIDLNPGPEGSSPWGQTAVDGLVYFVATDSEGHAALWRTDGSAGGTDRLSPFFPPLTFQPLRRFPRAGNFLYFVADDGSRGPELWRLDLTNGSVGPVVTLGGEIDDAGPSGFFVLGGRLLFRGRDAANVPSIYATDGTAAGTERLVTGAGLLGPIFAVGETAYFATDDPATGAFFATDGTPAGTAIASPLPAWALGRALTPLGPGPGVGFVVAADDGRHGTEPFLFTPTAGAANQPPVLGPIPDRDVIAGDVLEFTIGASDPDAGQTLRFALAAPDLVGATLDPVTGAFRYAPSTATAGTFLATVTVTDNGAPPRSALTSFFVCVSSINHAPVLDPIDDQEVAAGEVLVVTPVATDPDPGQSLRFALVTPDLAGATIDPVTGVFRYSPALDVSGLFPVSITVRDDGSPVRSQGRQFLVLITPFNHAPVLNPIADGRTTAETPWSFAAVASDEDADQRLSYTIAAPSGLNAAIGSLDGKGSILPGGGVTGTFVVTVTVSDDAATPKSTSRSFTLVVDPPPPGNAPPALADIPDQSVIQLDTLSFRVVGSDPDAGQAIAYSLGVDRPSGATIDATGTVTWTPGPSQAPGDFVFSVIVTDNAASPLSATKTVRVHVAPFNTPPTLGPIGDIAIDEGGSAAFTPSFGDIDAGQSLAFTATAGTIDPATGAFRFDATDELASPLSVTITVRDDGTPAKSDSRTFAIRVRNVAPSVTIGGALDLEAPGVLVRTGSFADPGADAWTATVDYGDGLGPRPLALGPDRSFSLEKTYAAAGVYLVRVSVDDGDGGVGTASFQVRANTRPTIAPIADQIVPEGSLLVIAPTYGDADAGQTLSFAAMDGAIDAAGVVRYLAADDGPAIAAAVTARDDGSPVLAATRNFRITVVNVAPTVTIDAGPTVLDSGVFSGGGGFADPGADAWAAVVDYGDGTRGPLALGGDRRFSLGHRYAAPGRYAVIVQVDDGDGGVGTTRLDLLVPSPPTPAPEAATVRVAPASAEIDRTAGAAAFMITRTGGLSGGMRVRFDTADGTARAGEDYDAVSGVIEFAPGETSRTVLVPLRADGPGGRSFRLVLSAPDGGAVLGAESEATVTVRPVPPPPLVTVASAALQTKKKGGASTIVVRFSGKPDAASAASPGAYAFAVRIKKGKKFVTKPIAIRSATYDDAIGSVTLTPAGRTIPKGTPTLKIVGSGIKDRAGRALDGNSDGRPGGDAVLTLGRIVVKSAVRP